jgi:hypothetical protein
MFVDVDLFPASGGSITLGESLRRVWEALRGRATQARLERIRQLEQRALAKIDEVATSQPDLGFRIYRTRGGFRLLVTSGGYDPAAADTLALLKAFGSDPLYIRLCESQACFRARLSAKHWRCGVRRPPSRFPWEDAAEERAYRAWENEYHRVANTLAVCEAVGSRGPSAVDESIRTVLDTHDRLTMQPGAKLA